MKNKTGALIIKPNEIKREAAAFVYSGLVIKGRLSWRCRSGSEEFDTKLALVVWSHQMAWTPLSPCRRPSGILVLWVLSAAHRLLLTSEELL